MMTITTLSATVRLGNFFDISGIDYNGTHLFLLTGEEVLAVPVYPEYSSDTNKYAVVAFKPWGAEVPLKNDFTTTPGLKIKGALEIKLSEPELFSDFEWRILSIVTACGITFQFNVHTMRNP